MYKRFDIQAERKYYETPPKKLAITPDRLVEWQMKLCTGSSSWPALLNQKRVLEVENGIIYVKVPSLDWIIGPLGKMKKRDFEPLVHLYHFSQRSLSICLEQAGLKPVLWSMEPPSSGSLSNDLGYLVLKALEKITWGTWPGVYFSLAVFAHKN